MYQEQGKKTILWMKIDNPHWDDQMLELSDKDFETAIVKTLQQLWIL